MSNLKVNSNVVVYLVADLLLSAFPSVAHAAPTASNQSMVSNSTSFFSDDTYERICLVLGWIECAEWRILDQSGIERNRVVGPYPESALRALCGSNLCGGGQDGRVELIRVIPKEVVPVTDYGPGSRNVDSSSPVGSNPESPESSQPRSDTSQPTPKLGGYAVVHPETRHVCGVVVATLPQIMSSEYMGCPAGSQTYFQTLPSETGNVAGYHGKDVTFYGGTFYLSWGTIVDGIATDRNGRVWETGTGRVLNEGSQPPPSSGESSQSSSLSPVSANATDSQTLSSSPQSSASSSSSTSAVTRETQSGEVVSSDSESATINQAQNSPEEEIVSLGKTVVGSFLGRWAVRFENLAGSVISIRAGGNWHKFTLTSNNQLFSRRSFAGADVRLQIWVDGIPFSDASVVVR